MEPLFRPDDYPLKTLSNLFLYETFCRTLDANNDREYLLYFIRAALKRMSSSNIERSFFSEVIYRKIENDSNSILKEISRYLFRVGLWVKENAQVAPPQLTQTLTPFNKTHHLTTTTGTFLFKDRNTIPLVFPAISSPL